MFKKGFTSVLFALLLLFFVVLPAFALPGWTSDPERVGSYADAALAVVGAASVLANFSKTDADNKAISWIGKVVHFLAGNWFTLVKRK